MFSICYALYLRITLPTPSPIHFCKLGDVIPYTFRSGAGTHFCAEGTKKTNSSSNTGLNIAASTSTLSTAIMLLNGGLLRLGQSSALGNQIFYMRA